MIEWCCRYEHMVLFKVLFYTCSVHAFHDITNCLLTCFLPPSPSLAFSVSAASMDTSLRWTKHSGPMGSTSPLCLEGTGFIPHPEMCFSLICWFSRQMQQELRRCIVITLYTSIFQVYIFTAQSTTFCYSNWTTELVKAISACQISQVCNNG
jgi:hypothetical protein